MSNTKQMSYFFLSLITNLSQVRCLWRPKLCEGVFSPCAVKISRACPPERERQSGSPQGALFSRTHTHTHMQGPGPADIVALIHPLEEAVSPLPPPPLAFSSSPFFFRPSTLLLLLLFIIPLVRPRPFWGLGR